MNRMTPNASLVILTGLMLSACTTIPEQLSGEYTALLPQETTERDLETTVRWGGVLLETRPEADYTCFEILSRPLEKSMRPKLSDKADGRFIACKPGFYDPEVFEKGREITLTGEIIRLDTRKVGEYDYSYPVVDISFMTLWPKRRQSVHVAYYGFYDPWYWYYPPYRVYYTVPKQ